MLLCVDILIKKYYYHVSYSDKETISITMCAILMKKHHEKNKNKNMCMCSSGIQSFYNDKGSY